jgi:hypothetical protein
MLLDEATAEFWRAGVFLQELCEKFEGAPLAPAARLPGRAEINTQGDPDVERRLPSLVDGTPWGCPWAIVDGDGKLLGTHGDFQSAETALNAMFGFQPLNTPAEAAELAKAQGTVRLVGMVPELAAAYERAATPFREFDLATAFAVPSGTVEAEPFPLSPVDEVFERPSGLPEWRSADEEPLERCGVMSRTKRVCIRDAGHGGPHTDSVAEWYAGS